MRKVKYYYDVESLSYKKIKSRIISLRGTFLFLLASALFGLFFVYIAYKVLESPNEKYLKREVDKMKLEYGLLDKKMSQVKEILAEIQERDNNIYRLYFEANPIPDEQRKAGFGGVNRYKSLEGFDNSKMITDVTKKMDIITKQLYIQSKSLDEIVKLAENKEHLLASIPAIQPVRNDHLKQMASGYGWRKDPFTKVRKMHQGMDFTAKTGTPIYATGNGVVRKADNSVSGFGKHIEISHGYGYTTIFAHLSNYNVRPGQRVKRGDLIGFVGNTGRSTGPHLHYEVHKNGKPVNPINYYYGSLTPQQFAAMQKLAEIEGQSLD